MSTPHPLSRAGWRRAGRGLLAALAALLLLAGCAGDGSDPTGGDGEVVIGLTDAPGDFLTYTVDVRALRLTRDDGAVVDTLPLTTRVDFARYVDLTEFLTAATVPAGRYVRAELTLDYQAADLRVEDPQGAVVTVPPQAIVDGDGQPVTTLTVAVRLAGRDALRIVPGVPAHLTLDFDLAASHAVDFSGDTPQVTVRPVLLADPHLQRPKRHRLRGPLAGVQPRQQRFEVILRPFRHRLVARPDFGTLTVQVDGRTEYDIDGRRYRGEAGLTALAALPRLTPVVVRGDLQPARHRFLARQVAAGRSVPGAGADAVEGNVVARAGDVLTVRGATLHRADGAIVFRDTLRVQLEAGTAVHGPLDPAPLDTAALSVGQHLRAFGSLSDDGATLTATRVRLLPTLLRGTRSGTDAAPDGTPLLALALQSIDRRDVAAFDFSGTGTTAADDADPAHYEVAVDGLAVDELPYGTPLQVRGQVAPWGSTPPDFRAWSVTDVRPLPATLVVDWGEGSTGALAAVGADGLTLDPAGAERFHHVSRGGVRTDLAGRDSAPRILPGADGDCLCWIGDGETLRLYTGFAAFAAELAARQDGGAVVRRIQASGRYDDAANALTARRVEVRLR